MHQAETVLYPHLPPRSSIAGRWRYLFIQFHVIVLTDEVT